MHTAEKTVYISDMDGTLLGNTAKLSSRAARMLNCFADNGVMFTVASARRRASIVPIMKDVKLNLPIIALNGAVIYDTQTERHIRIHTLSEAARESAFNYITAKDEAPLIYAIVDGVERVSYLKSHAKKLKFYLASRKADPTVRECETISELWRGEIFYITVFNPETDMNDFVGALTDIDTNLQPDTYDKTQVWFEIFQKGVSKAAAALEVKAIAMAERLVVFGDNYNDVSMFKAADEAYAVENAVDSLKAIASGIIPANTDYGVPLFIEKRTTPVFDYEHMNDTDPDKYAAILKHDMNSGTHTVGTHTVRTTEPRHAGTHTVRTTEHGNEPALPREIGTLNEKTIHRTLKQYYGTNIDREAKIGTYYADVINESGIIEIQTRGLYRLRGKLAAFLRATHVTIVYPHHKTVVTNGGAGSRTRNFRLETVLFDELYGIREFLTNPNLTIRIAELKVHKSVVGGKKRVVPVELLGEVTFRDAADYARFIPAGLPDTFTKRDFAKAARTGTGNLTLEVLHCVGAVRYCGKRGNAAVYGRGGGGIMKLSSI